MAVTVVRDVVNGRTFTVSGSGGNRMYLYSESGRLALAVDIAPQEIDYGGWAMDWSEAERSGDKPLLLHKGMSLRTLGFSFMVVDRVDSQASQTSKVSLLQQMSRTFERMLVAFSPSEQGLWRIKDLKVKSVYRTEDTDEISRAEVDITLVEASDPAPAVGPITTPATKPATPPAPVRITHIVKKGDTLSALALRYYRNASLWPRIFDANRDKIRDPHWIYPSQRFIIP